MLIVLILKFAVVAAFLFMFWGKFFAGHFGTGGGFQTALPSTRERTFQVLPSICFGGPMEPDKYYVFTIILLTKYYFTLYKKGPQGP